MTPQLGPLLHSFFVDYLPVQKGLKPASLRSYRDAIRLFLCYAAKRKRVKVTRLTLADMTADRVRLFLTYLEQERGNHIRTRNQRLAALRSFFEYVATRAPEALPACSGIAGIPTKRVAPPETAFLERHEVATLFQGLPATGKRAGRDRALLLFLYNTGARAQEAADLRVEHLVLEAPARVHLHGKGSKWRTCPLWAETVQQLQQLLGSRGFPLLPDAPVFAGPRGRPLTRFGIYKIVRRHAAFLDGRTSTACDRRATPHIFRHTAAVHLLEAGVEANVIRGWLGHVSLETTNRYAEITTRAKAAALETCEANIPGSSRRQAVWRNDDALLTWLGSL